MKNPPYIPYFHIRYVGKSFSAMGDTMLKMINALTGKKYKSLCKSILATIGLNKYEYHIFNMKVGPITFIAIYDPIERINTYDAHKITIIGVFDDKGQIYGGDADYKQRLMDEWAKHSERQTAINGEIMRNLINVPAVNKPIQINTQFKLI